MIRNLREIGPYLQKIVTRLQSNQNLLKYLYYTDKDPLANQDLSKKQIQEEIFNKLIKIVPRVGPKETAKSLISIRVVNGHQNDANNQIEDLSVAIEVFVPMTQWIIKDENLRPFCIMGEIQNSLNGKNIDGLGRVHGGDFAVNFFTDEISCYEMTYSFSLYD
jgi:hypothetical protein